MAATQTETPETSKFLLILLAAKRARQIQSGARPLIHTTARKPTRVAQEELKAGVLPYEVQAITTTDGSERDSASAHRKPAPIESK